MSPKIYHIPSDEEDLQQMISAPLLVDAGTEPEGPAKPTTGNTTNTKWSVVVGGAITGFFIQVVSLGAYALLLVHYHQYVHNNNGNASTVNDWMTLWSNTSNNSTEDWKTMVNVDWFIYGILSVLTQIDLVIYVLIWIAFTCTMTKHGMQFLRFQYQNPALKRRSIFVLGVYFLVGIVLGAFGAWSMIDVYLGFPIPFLPIVATVGIDLVLCYMMVWCYDLGRGTSSVSKIAEEIEQLEDGEEEECICC